MTIMHSRRALASLERLVRGCGRTYTTGDGSSLPDRAKALMPEDGLATITSRSAELAPSGRSVRTLKGLLPPDSESLHPARKDVLRRTKPRHAGQSSGSPSGAILASSRSVRHRHDTIAAQSGPNTRQTGDLETWTAMITGHMTVLPPGQPAIPGKENVRSFAATFLSYRSKSRGQWRRSSRQRVRRSGCELRRSAHGAEPGRRRSRRDGTEVPGRVVPRRGRLAHRRQHLEHQLGVRQG